MATRTNREVQYSTDVISAVNPVVFVRSRDLPANLNPVGLEGQGGVIVVIFALMGMY